MSVEYLFDGNDRSLRTFLSKILRDLDNKKVVNAAICYESSDGGVDYFICDTADKISVIGMLNFMATAIGVSLLSEKEE